MIRVAGQYRWREGAEFNFDYYQDRHMALTVELLKPFGLIRLESDKVLSGDDPQVGTIIAVSHAYFESLAQAKAALTACGPKLLADVVNYSNLTPEMVISHVDCHL